MPVFFKIDSSIGISKIRKKIRKALVELYIMVSFRLILDKENEVHIITLIFYLNFFKFHFLLKKKMSLQKLPLLVQLVSASLNITNRAGTIIRDVMQSGTLKTVDKVGLIFFVSFMFYFFFFFCMFHLALLFLTCFTE